MQTPEVEKTPFLFFCGADAIIPIPSIADPEYFVLCTAGATDSIIFTAVAKNLWYALEGAPFPAMLVPKNLFSALQITKNPKLRAAGGNHLIFCTAKIPICAVLMPDHQHCTTDAKNPFSALQTPKVWRVHYACKTPFFCTTEPPFPVKIQRPTCLYCWCQTPIFCTPDNVMKCDTRIDRIIQPVVDSVE